MLLKDTARTKAQTRGDSAVYINPPVSVFVHVVSLLNIATEVIYA